MVKGRCCNVVLSDRTIGLHLKILKQSNLGVGVARARGGVCIWKWLRRVVTIVCRSVFLINKWSDCLLVLKKRAWALDCLDKVNIIDTPPHILLQSSAVGRCLIWLLSMYWFLDYLLQINFPVGDISAASVWVTTPLVSWITSILALTAQILKTRKSIRHTCQLLSTLDIYTRK